VNGRALCRRSAQFRAAAKIFALVLSSSACQYPYMFVTRGPTSSKPVVFSFWLPAGCAIGAALVAVLLVLLVTGVRKQPPRADPENRWRRLAWRLADPVYAPAAWSLTDSWTTNITAVGSVLGVVAGASSALSAYIATTFPFVALSLLFGGAAVLAPVVYAALSESWGQADQNGEVAGSSGSVAGLLLAAMFTLFGFFGEIFVAFDVAVHATKQVGARAAFWVAVILVVLVVGLYAYRSLRWTLLLKNPAEATAPAKPAAADHATLQGPADTARPASRISGSGKASATL